jgi:hypothetical protein
VDIDDHPADVLRTRRMALAQSDLPINQRWHRWCALALRSALELRSFRRYLPHAPACFIAKDEDVQRVPNRNVFVLPNIPLVQHSIEAQCTREEHALLVVASWGWYPNHAGLTAFLRRAWATVRTAVPDARLYIVGSGLSEETKGEWAAVRGVVVVGTVDKLNEWYSRTAFSLAPIELGGGTSIKVLESLAYSRTLVTTRHGARGYEKCLLDGEALLVADDWQGFASHCIRLLREPEFRDRLARQGQEIVRREYSVARVDRVVGEALRRAQALVSAASWPPPEI